MGRRAEERERKLEQKIAEQNSTIETLKQIIKIMKQEVAKKLQKS